MTTAIDSAERARFLPADWREGDREQLIRQLADESCYQVEQNLREQIRIELAEREAQGGA